ncbi:branched-chain amino acid ABC transporter permease [uncultured Enterovirga sp.]|uniref:branched-chain amino acid ABC transporter permease n=1 Tax=uncultured Enterovirga sp. TaxID=2026352 RepID=UPI0035C9F1E7
MDLSSFAQLAINGVVTGLIISLGALGITLVFGLARFANVAAGDMATLGAYAALVGASTSGSMTFGVGAALVATALVGACLHLAVYQRLEGRPSIAFLVCSIGVAFLIRSVVGFTFGHGQNVYPVPLTRPYIFGDVRIGVVDMQVFLMTVAALAVAFGILRFTAIGREMRAVADSIDLARLSGIKAQRVMIALWALVGCLSAVSGVALGLKAVIIPEIGWETLLPSFAAAILGGLGSPVGAVVAGVVLGIVQEISTPILGFSYKITLAFFVILAVLLVRPNGLFGKRELVR